MWEKTKEQIPTIAITAALIIGAGAFMLNTVTTRQSAALAPLREQNETLRAQGEENRRQIEATTKLLKEAIAQHDGDVFRSDEEIQKLSSNRIAQLADEIAKKINPGLSPVRSPADAARLQDEQVDKVATRLTENLRPVLASQSMGANDQKLRESEQHEEQLSADLRATQAAAQDALKLTHEVSALYYDSFKDQGVVIRLLSLPANLVIDTAKGNLITSRDRTKVEQELSAKMSEIEKRLQDVRTNASGSRT